MNIQQLIQMAPFMSREAVAEMAFNLDGSVTAPQLARLAPFLGSENLSALIEKHNPQLDWQSLRRMAPYLSREQVDALTKQVAANPADNNAFNQTAEALGNAFDELSRNMDKTARRMVRKGRKLWHDSGADASLDELSQKASELGRKAMDHGKRLWNEFTDAVTAENENIEQHARRTAELRTMAFEKALEAGRWDWLGAHIEELKDEILLDKIAETALEHRQYDWIAEHMGLFADENTIDYMIEQGKWEALGDIVDCMEPELQQKLALAAADAGQWTWLEDNAARLTLFETAETLFEKARAAAQPKVAACIFDECYTEEMRQSYLAQEDAPLQELIGYSTGETLGKLLLGIAKKGEWSDVEKHLEALSPSCCEALMELAIEQGNFDAIDMISRVL